MHGHYARLILLSCTKGIQALNNEVIFYFVCFVWSWKGIIIKLKAQRMILENIIECSTNKNTTQLTSKADLKS